MSAASPPGPADEPPPGSGIGRSTALMAAGTAVSRVLGVVRLAVLAAAVGVNAAAANAFAVANTLPNMLYMLVAGGVLNAVLVPQVVRAYRSDRGQDYVDRLLTLSIVLLVGITVTLTAAAPLIVRLVASDTDPAFIPLATVFAFWCIPQVFFYGLYTLLGQVLNARGSFGPYMWAPVVNNIVSIIGFGVFIAVFGRYVRGGPLSAPEAWDAEHIALLAGSATLGIVVQALVLTIPLYRSGFRYRPRWDWRGAGLGSAGRVAGWTFAALAVGQLGIIVVTRVTTGATQAGGYAPDVAGNFAYTNAFVIFMLPHSLVTVSLLTALFTRLSAHASDGDLARVRADTGFGLRTIGVVMLLSSAVLAVLALPLVRVVLPTASPAEAGSLAPVVVALTAGLVALGAWSLWQRIYYAYQDARGLFWIQVAMAGVVATGTLVGAAVLPVRWWAAGAGASIAASYLLGALWGAVRVRQRLGGSGAASVRVLLRATIAAAVSAAVGWPLSRLFGDLSQLGFARAVVVCVVVGTVMLAVYVGLLRVLRVGELTALVMPLLNPLRARLSRTMGTRAERRRGHGGDRVGVVVGRGTLLAGRYRLDALAPSDLPDVHCWHALDQILDRPVRALVIRAGRVRQAQDAARRAALVSDPRLLRVLDVGDHEGLAYVITEPIVGHDLATLTADGPLPADQARAIVGEAAVALEVARRRGVHHLALRPGALHVLPDGGVVVSGLAMDGELAGHGLGDARSTTRADTVGLVALLYLALTGRWPAPAGVTTTETSVPVIDGEVPAPGELAAGVPNDLDTLCAVTLGPHDDGPHSPAELVRELEPWNTLDPAAVTDGLLQRAAAAQVAATRAAAGVAAPAADDEPGAADAAPDHGAGPRGDAPEPGATEVPSEPEPGETTSDPSDPGASPDGFQDETATLVVVTGTAAAATDAADATAGAGAGAGAGAQPGPASVPRHPARSSMAQTPGPPARPGTPPPAIPPSVLRPDPRSGPGAAPVMSGGATPTSSTAAAGLVRPHPSVSVPVDRGPHPAPAPVNAAVRPTTDHRDFDSIIGRSADVLTRRRFDPTPVVILLVLVAIVVGLMYAWQALTAPAPPIGGTDGFGDVSQSQQEPPIDETEAPPAASDDDGAEAPAVAPVIASAQMLDPPPDGDENEHPEAVQAAIDGDPSTFWYSRTYVSPVYGMKQGIGYAVTLAEPATVTSIRLLVNGSGGMVEVRATDPSTPTEGEVLASGPLAPETVLTLSTPTTASHVVLWFTALPQTADGSNRVELAEITLS